MNTIEDFLDAYIESNNLNKQEFTSSSRRRELVDARMVYCSVARKCGDFTLKQIGQSINRDHATALHAIRNYDVLSEMDKDLVNKYNKTVVLYNMLFYTPDAKSNALMDTLFRSNSKLRKLITIRDSRIEIQNEEIKGLKNKIKLIVKELTNE
jgi:hypothetical protein